MPRRACVIVLDAVGLGELPGAADWGDGVEFTLGNVSRAVGVDLPNLEALGLGNIEPLEKLSAAALRPCRRWAPRRALEGEGHDRRSLGADGRRHADPLPDVHYGFPTR